MISWAGLLAWTGFHYSAVTQSLAFAAKEGTFFWSNGWAYGIATLKRQGADFSLTLQVRQGQLACQKVVLAGHGSLQLKKSQLVTTGMIRTFVIKNND